MPPEIQRHYESNAEALRLFSGAGRLELARTQEIISRYLPPPPAVILDVGGGPGVYASWLSGLGHDVHLIDPVPLHVDQALKNRGTSAARKLSAQTGDARHLRHPDQSVDMVLLLGPLYHLTLSAERIAALREAMRVTRQGGVVIAACITRCASMLDGLFHGRLEDPRFADIVRRDLNDGQHRNPTREPTWFTTAYFHRPAELGEEMTEAGLSHQATLAVEGPAWLLSDFDAHWDGPARRQRLLEMVRLVETEPSLLGASAHLLAVGHRR